jgi:hypothetical protein
MGGAMMAKDFGLKTPLGAPLGRKVPKQKPGRSEQTVATPRDFLDAVEKRFGKMTWDLAATSANAITRNGNYFGPDHCVTGRRDALINDWTKRTGNLWLNPEFGDIAPWVKKCAELDLMGRHSGRLARLFLLVPASVGSNWFHEFVFSRALVLFLSPRLTFVGHTQAYPKDLLLACYGFKPGFEWWRWKP